MPSPVSRESGPRDRFLPAIISAIPANDAAEASPAASPAGALALLLSEHSLAASLSPAAADDADAVADAAVRRVRPTELEALPADAAEPAPQSTKATTGPARAADPTALACPLSMAMAP